MLLEQRTSALRMHLSYSEKTEVKNAGLGKEGMKG